jgi:hypothetical protein
VAVAWLALSSDTAFGVACSPGVGRAGEVGAFGAQGTSTIVNTTGGLPPGVLALRSVEKSANPRIKATWTDSDAASGPRIFCRLLERLLEV